MTMNRAAALAGSVVVVVAVLSGLYLGGSPGVQRSLRFDEQRVDDLRTLTRAIKSHWKATQRLPDELQELVDGQNLRSMPLDPESRAIYDFNATAAHAYRLCADFSEPSAETRREDFWEHQAGRQCFDLVVIPEGSTK